MPCAIGTTSCIKYDNSIPLRVNPVDRTAFAVIKRTMAGIFRSHGIRRGPSCGEGVVHAGAEVKQAQVCGAEALLLLGGVAPAVAEVVYGVGAGEACAEGQVVVLLHDGWGHQVGGDVDHRADVAQMVRGEQAVAVQAQHVHIHGVYGLVGKFLHLRDPVRVNDAGFRHLLHGGRQVEEEASFVPGDALHLGGPVRAEVRVVGIDERPQVALLDAVPGAVVGPGGDLGAVAEPGIGEGPGGTGGAAGQVQDVPVYTHPFAAVIGEVAPGVIGTRLY